MTFEEFSAEVRAEFPDFKIIPKVQSRLMRAIGALLKAVSFGRMNTFMDYVTTIGYTVYTPDDWDGRDAVTKIIVLRHERVHMRQRRKYGSVLFSLLYLFPFLPLFLAYWRKKFEMEAYEESMRAEVEFHGPTSVLSSAFREEMVSQFTGPAYGWCWPFRKSVQKWCLDSAEKAIEEHGQSKGN